MAIRMIKSVNRTTLNVAALLLALILVYTGLMAKDRITG